MPELSSNAYNTERIYPMPDEAAELEQLEYEGRFISHTFEGLDVKPEELRDAQAIVAEEHEASASRAAKQALEEADAISVWHHSGEVALLSVLALRRMGMSERAQRIAARAAFSHDVGKEHPDVLAAIDTPGELDESRRRKMEDHSIYSARFAQEHGASPEDVAAILMHHKFVRVNEAKYKRPYPENATLVGGGLGEIVSQVLARDPEIITVIATLALADAISACATAGKLRDYHRAAQNYQAALAMAQGEIDINVQSLREVEEPRINAPIVDIMSDMAA